MTMGLLKSVKNVPGIDYYDYRESDYWNKYKYRARFVLEGARLLYFAKDINQFVNRVSNGGYKYSPLGDKDKANILNKTHVFSNLLDLQKTLIKTKEGCVRIENYTVAIFGNDLAKLHEIKKWDSNLSVDFTEAQTGMYAGVKYFVRQPKSNYRVYLRSKRVDEKIMNDLKEFFVTHKNLKPSNALKVWIGTLAGKKYTYRSRYCSSAYFIDYDDESTLSLLALMHGDLIGRRYKLEKR